MRIRTIAKREVKMGFRNAWTYSFLILLTVFVLALLLLQSGVSGIEAYTDQTSTMMNMTLYILPLLTLLIGGFSATSEKESSQWGLLSTYPITTYQFVFGKWLGLSMILIAMLFVSFGVSAVITLLFGQTVTLEMMLFFWLFSAVLTLVFLAISLVIGALSANRWQALIAGIFIWFVTIMIWPLLMISTLSHLPKYPMIQPTLEVLTLLNPAETIRVFSIIRLEAGSMFGATYHEWITWAEGTTGLITFIGFILAWIIIPLLLSGWLWKRGERRG